MRRWLISVVLITAPVAGALCATKAMQEYKALALAPDGMRVAVVEPVAGTTGDAHGPIAIRGTDNGRILEHIDPCQCDYSGLAWSQDGTHLVFLAAEDKAKTVRLEVATLSAATPHAIGSISAQRESRIDVPLEPSVTLAKSSVSIDRVRRCRPRSTC